MDNVDSQQKRQQRPSLSFIVCARDSLRDIFLYSIEYIELYRTVLRQLRKLFISRVSRIPYVNNDVILH